MNNKKNNKFSISWSNLHYIYELIKRKRKFKNNMSIDLGPKNYEINLPLFLKGKFYAKI